MKHTLRSVLILGATLLLVQCQQQSEETPEKEPVYGAVDGVDWTMLVMQEFSPVDDVRPSAQVGVYIAQYLLDQTRLRSALIGVDAQIDLLNDEEFEENEAFMLLEELGTLLQVDIPDMLNRSTRRGITFDAYVSDLLGKMEESTAMHESLEQELEIINDDRREQRKVTGDIQRNLNGALREQDYSAASALQEQLIEAESELATFEALEDQTRSVVRLFEKLLEIAEERLLAMRANREALLAGIKVVDIPGVDDLGLIESASRSDRQFDDSDGIFGPPL